MGRRAGNRTTVALIAVFAAVALGTSLWMVVAPRSFFANIGPFGVFNGHYLRDVAAFQAGIGAALLASIWLRELRSGAVAALLGATALHTFNHWVDVRAAHAGSNADVVDAVLLTCTTLLVAWLFASTLRPVAGSAGRG